ncbi:SDR family NAD(P)-dependent oxidoreductase [Mesorhizobium sp. CAU 1741]|uniref:SDR family NAD(P)-dependent oxidoreductase n=1 Tax=Mesorhizobium sp. CAU 1741 TaxID=3140366 RepID=UPI00325B9443
MSMQQKPLGTAFGPATTAEEVARGIDLSGKIAIVTGGASGLGLETTRVLSGQGAKVLVPARDVAAASKALADLPSVEVASMDLIDPTSVADFAKGFLDSGQPLHLLILNAGIMAPPLFRDGDGREGQFATNHLGHFRLTAALWPALKAAGSARVVVLSSRGHQLGGFDLDDQPSSCEPAMLCSNLRPKASPLQFHRTTEYRGWRVRGMRQSPPHAKLRGDHE